MITYDYAVTLVSVSLRGALFSDDVPAFLEILYRGSWYYAVICYHLSFFLVDQSLPLDGGG